MLRPTLVAAVALSFLGLGLAAPAQAQGGGNKIQGIRPDVHLNIGYDDLGVGFRIDIPIVPDGFLQSASRVTDELALSPGLDLMFYDYDGRFCHDHGSRGDHCHGRRLGFWPLIMVQWNLYFQKPWSVFPELGLVFLINDGYRDNHHGDFAVTLGAGFGARYHFNARMSLLLRLVWPGGFQVGLTF